MCCLGFLCLFLAQDYNIYMSYSFSSDVYEIYSLAGYYGALNSI